MFEPYLSAPAWPNCLTSARIYKYMYHQYRQGKRVFLRVKVLPNSEKLPAERDNVHSDSPFFEAELSLLQPCIC